MGDTRYPDIASSTRTVLYELPHQAPQPAMVGSDCLLTGSHLEACVDCA